MKKILMAVLFAGLMAVGSAGAQVVVRIGPPRPPREIITVRPGPNYIWTPGFYRYAGQRYEWVPGRYVIPPRPRARWIPGHWVHRHRGYVWMEGRWR